jgi:hypothetical protein
MAIPMTPSAAVSDFGGRRYHRFVPICRKNRPLSSIQFIIGEKFIGGVLGIVVSVGVRMSIAFSLAESPFAGLWNFLASLLIDLSGT